MRTKREDFVNIQQEMKGRERFQIHAAAGRDLTESKPRSALARARSAANRTGGSPLLGDPATGEPETALPVRPTCGQEGRRKTGGARAGTRVCSAAKLGAVGAVGVRGSASDTLGLPRT
jgi:hypothetical protein